MNAQPCVWDAGVIQQHAGTKKAGAEPACVRSGFCDMDARLKKLEGYVDFASDWQRGLDQSC